MLCRATESVDATSLIVRDHQAPVGGDEDINWASPSVPIREQPTVHKVKHFSGRRSGFKWNPNDLVPCRFRTVPRAMERDQQVAIESSQLFTARERQPERS